MAQIKTMYEMWAPWTSKSGKLLFPGFAPGTESLPEFALANPGINFGSHTLSSPKAPSSADCQHDTGPGPDFFEYDH